MKKIAYNVMVILLVLIQLTGCGSLNRIAKGQASKSDFVGTYVGLHGSGITLFENGGAEYYWKEWDDVETGDTWEYENKKITFHSRNLGYDICAEVDNGNTSSLNFVGVGKNTWDDEIFVKISDDVSSKDVEAYVALIEKQLNTDISAEIKKSPTKVSEVQSNNDNCVLYEYCGIEFILPEGYQIYDDGIASEEHMAFMKTEKLDDLSASIMESILTKPDGPYGKWIKKHLRDSFDGEEILSETSDSLSTKEFDISVYKYECDKYVTYYAVIGDHAREVKVLVTFINLNKNNEMVEKEFYEMLSTISKTYSSSDKKSVKVDTDDNNDLGTATSEEVDPSLKAFLNSYEDYIDEYCDFMKSYSENSTDLEMISKYTKMLQTLQDFETKANKYNKDEMSDADLKYYTEVMSRCSIKMLEAASSQY